MSTVRMYSSRTSIFFRAIVRKMSPIALILFSVILVIFGAVNLLRRTPDVELGLYTKKNPVNATNVLRNASNLKDTSFDPSKTTVVIVHAFQDFENKCMAVIRDAYLENTDSNVIVVSWLQRSGLHAKRYAEDLAEMLSVFLDDLILKSNRSLIHVIGISLGAQIVGLAAKNMKNGPLSRIVALDPEKPIFEDKDDAKYLDMDDAEFVVVIHTTGDILSFSKSIGHADFYPNGGTSPQPYCSEKKADVKSCSHQMACMYYAESLYNPMAFPATLCDSWLEYKNGKCSDNDQVIMGAYTPSSARGSFYLEMIAGTPYGNGAKEPEVKDTKQISTVQRTKLCPIDIFLRILFALVSSVFILIVYIFYYWLKAMLRAKDDSMQNATTLSSNNQKYDCAIKKINKINEKIEKGLMLSSDHQTNDKKINLT